MHSNPYFSIIIPTYNRSALLHKAIASVVGQAYTVWELIIIDDGSTDDTKRVVEKWDDSRIQYYFQSKSERSAARNKGIELAQGSHICFLDDDDEFGVDYLQSFADFIKENDCSHHILRCGFYKMTDGGKQLKKTRNYVADQDKNPVHFVAFNMCGVGSLCIPRAYLTADRFPEAFPHWQDTHLFLRLLAKHPFSQLPVYTYYYRIHPKMGSRALFTPESFYERMELNLAAIKDLFDKYGKLVNPFLPRHTREILIEEKMLQYAISAITKLGRRESFRIFRLAWGYRRGFKNIYLYLYYLYSFVRI